MNDFFKPYKNKIHSIVYIIERLNSVKNFKEGYQPEILSGIQEKIPNKFPDESNNLNYFKRALIYFSDQDSADNFYCEYNARIFPCKNLTTNKSEFLYCSFIDKIYKCQIEKLDNKANDVINIDLKDKLSWEKELIREVSVNSFEKELNRLDSIIKIKDENFNQNIFFTTNINHQEISELSTCPICLERLDTSASGITSIKTTSWLIDSERWNNYKIYCSVCSMINIFQKIYKANNILNFYNKSQQEMVENNIQKSLKCSGCDEHQSLWICLICGVIGCDRYKSGHAVEHFEYTYHRYSIDMTHERIWDYKDDKWVHRVLKIVQNDDNINPHSHLSQSNTENNSSSNNINNTSNNNDELHSNMIYDYKKNDMLSKILITLEENNYNNNEEENLNSKEFLMKIENIICEYNFVLSEQLEQQRVYYENEIQKITEKNEEVLKNKISYITNANDQGKFFIEKNSQNKKLIKEYGRKLYQQIKKIAALQENIKLTEEISSNMCEDIKEIQIKNVFIFLKNF